MSCCRVASEEEEDEEGEKVEVGVGVAMSSFTTRLDVEDRDCEGDLS